MRTSAIVSVCLLFLGLGLSSQVGYAGNVYYFDITNNSGASRDSLHLDFTGTGGTATLVLVANATGCGSPTVSNPGTPWEIDWSSACVDNAEKITIKIYSDNPVTFDSGSWFPDTVALASGDVVATAAPVPALTDWGIGALVFTVLAAAVLLFVRRRHVAAA